MDMEKKWNTDMDKAENKVIKESFLRFIPFGLYRKLT